MSVAADSATNGPSDDFDENTPLLSNVISTNQLGPNDENGTTTVSEEARLLYKAALPVVGTFLLEYSLQIASVVSIGHLSTMSLAAVSLGSMTAVVSGLSIIQGFASSLETVLPSAWTSSTPQLVGLWAQRMAVVMVVVIVPIFVVWFNAERILLVLRQDPEVAKLAGLYLRCLCLGLPAYAFNSISRRYFISQGLFTVPVHIIMIVAPINVLLNYALVWGPAPIRIGFIGGPVAVAISYNLISVFSIIYGVFFIPRTAWHPLSRRMFQKLGLLTQLGLSGVGQIASEWWSWELVALAASFLSPTTLATHSVLSVTASSFYLVPLSLSISSSVRVGNYLGERNANRASLSANAAFMISSMYSAVSCSMLLVFKKSWGRLFTEDEEVVSLVAGIMPLLASCQFIDGWAAIAGGLLRARGMQSVGALLNVTGYFIIGVPFGIWLAFSGHLGLLGLWVGLVVAETYCAATSGWLCFRADWDLEVVKVQERISADQVKHGAEDA